MALLSRLGIEVTGLRLSTKKGTPLYNKEVNKGYYRKKDVYMFYVRGKSRKKFAELIGFTISRKMQRLLNAIQRNKRSTPPPNFNVENLINNFVGKIILAPGGPRTRDSWLLVFSDLPSQRSTRLSYRGLLSYSY